jgi:hypothetical protein
MKYLIAFILLTNITFALEDYRDNADGTSSYIGRCMLHDDYADDLYTVTDIEKTVSDPGMDYVSSLTDFKLALVLFAMGDLGHFDLEDMTVDSGYPFFDDITLQKVSFKDVEFKKQKIYRVSYGAGGGNGGFLTVVLNTTLIVNGKTQYLFKKVGHTFDRDLEFCDYSFMKRIQKLTKVPVRK